MTDPVAQITLLRQQREATTDLTLRAALDAAIAALEAALPERSHTLTIQDNTQVGVAVAGDHYGHVFLYGQRGTDATALLAGYLHRQLQRCGSLPLQGVYQQKAADDVLTISLEQVYTQLATTALVERERIAGAALARFDAAAYLEQHRADDCLPAIQRDQCIVQGGAAAQRMGGAPPAYRLATLTPDDLARLAHASDRLIFHGPHLVTEAIAANPHLVLLGEPGSGKSTALRYLALTLAQAGLDTSFDLPARLPGWAALGDRGRLLPLFLSLLPFARRVVTPSDHPGTADDLWNYIAAELEKDGRFTGLAAAVYDELEAGRVLLMLDGLDEVTGAESRRQVVRAVQAFGAQYPQCRIVVTCRVRAYVGEQNQEWQLGWQTATLADWTLGQMQHFVEAWYGAAAAASGMHPDKRDERTRALQRAITVRADLQRLGIRPLLLTIMALVHYNDGQLPEARVGLYSRCVDLLLGQWELAKADGSGYGKLTDYIGLPDTDVKALRPLLHQAAFQAHTASSAADPGSLGRATLRALVAEALEQRGHPKPFEGADRFLEYTDVRAGLLQASAAGEHYGFPHLTFQEYLAGLELVRGVAFVERILERRSDDRWRVPIQLGVGHLVSEGTLAGPYQLFNRLLKMKGRSGEQRQRDLLLVAELGADVGWARLTAGDDLFETLRDELAQALVPVVEGTTLPAADRVQAGVYLCDLRDPRRAVTDLPPEMVRIAGGSFVIGIGTEEQDAWFQAYTHDYPDVNEVSLRRYVQALVNNQPLTLPAFELARYPLTNAQRAVHRERWLRPGCALVGCRRAGLAGPR